MVRSRKNARSLDTHRYILWRDVVKRDDGAIVAEGIAISMGEHGEMQASPVSDRSEKPVSSTSAERLNDLAAHNIPEMRRAMEEAAKWEMRVKHSPLGKTQQDFVAYYTEVIAVFSEWRLAHGIPLPRDL